MTKLNTWRSFSAIIALVLVASLGAVILPASPVQAASTPMVAAGGGHTVGLKSDGSSIADEVHKLLGADDATPTGTMGANLFVVDAWQPAADGFVTQIRVKATANGHIKVAMYYDQNDGNINYVKNLMNAVNTGVLISAGWNTIAFPTTYVAAGRTYWIAYITDTNCVGYVNSGNNGYYTSATGGADFSSYLFEGVIKISPGFTPYGHSLLAGWGTGTGGSIDLAVEDIWTVPDPPLTTFPTASLWCRVRNLGDNSPPLRIDGEYSAPGGGATFLGPAIHVLNGVTGSSCTCFVDFLDNLPAGPHPITISVEPGDTTMTEPNKANNVMTKVITWQEPPSGAATENQSSGASQSSVEGEQLYRIQSLSGADSPLQVLSISAASGNQDAQIANSAVKTGSTTEVGPAHHIVFAEDFEGDFPGPGWQLYGNPTWGKTTYKPECAPAYDIDSGNYVGWCAAGGSLARDPKDYAPDMFSWMSLGPSSLMSGCQLEYDYFLSSWAYQYSDNRFYGDGFGQLESHTPEGCSRGNITSWYGGQWKEWQHETIELPIFPAEWIGFGFESTSPAHSGWEGAFVDNIVIHASGTGAPFVNNSTGATDVTDTSARLNGKLICDGGLDTAVTVYWGDNDGSTTEGNWDHNVPLGITTEGPFYTDISDFTEGTTYYYRCFASNSMGSHWASTTMSFTPCSSPAPQAPPTLKSPVSGATVSSLTPKLEWNVSTGATDYGLQVATTSSFATPLVDETGITELEYQIADGLSWGTTYYWRVNAHNCGGTSSWSAYRNFRTPVGPAVPAVVGKYSIKGSIKFFDWKCNKWIVVQSGTLHITSQDENKIEGYFEPGISIAGWPASDNVEGYVGPFQRDDSQKIKNKPRLSLFAELGTYCEYPDPTYVTYILNGNIKWDKKTDTVKSIKCTINGWGEFSTAFPDGSPSVGQFEGKFTATPPPAP